MQPTAIRDRVLQDHRELRARVARLDALSRAALAGTLQDTEVLRAETRELIRSLEQHMGWEDEHLLPALAEADEWGEERVQRMRNDHREQRELLRYATLVVDDPSRALDLLARTTLDLARLLQDDMQDEEEVMLDPSVLRDDPIGIDVESG
jgi:iron-sulfur cluster repair protein YtfE (RIC family)